MCIISFPRAQIQLQPTADDPHPNTKVQNITPPHITYVKAENIKPPAGKHVIVMNLKPPARKWVIATKWTVAGINSLISLIAGAALCYFGVCAIMCGGWAILGGLALIGAGIGAGCCAVTIIPPIIMALPQTFRDEWYMYTEEDAINDTDSNIKDCAIKTFEQLGSTFLAAIAGGAVFADLVLLLLAGGLVFV